MDVFITGSRPNDVVFLTFQYKLPGLTKQLTLHSAAHFNADTHGQKIILIYTLNTYCSFRPGRGFPHMQLSQVSMLIWAIQIKFD